MEEIIHDCNNFPRHLETLILHSGSPKHGLPLTLPKNPYTPIGFIRPSIIPLLAHHPTDFNILDHRVELSAHLSTPESRTEAIEKVLRLWKDQELFKCLKGWRSERYSVWGPNGEIVMQIERSGAALLGVPSFGCHLNGYVRDPANGEIKMWIARRSYTKQTYPGMLDNLVGGGLPHGTDPNTNIIKECYEEAGLSAEMASKVKPVSMITYFMDHPDRGWLPDTEYVYDLELPLDWKPNCQDGEVHEFYLLPLNEVTDKVKAKEFMPESALCVIDFLVRHGYVNVRNEPAYTEIAAGLRRTLPFPSPRYNSIK
ncbi:hypothetical protein HDV05_006957 [Chytridiales sp. JEL 0842]|nr:hypothetical protein HDV05_006957 [Chytridiales sp. JEL 0842]